MRPGLSPYNYVQNNPLSRIDPDGQLDFLYELFGINSSGSYEYSTINTSVENVQNTAITLSNEVNNTLSELNDAYIEPVSEPVVEVITAGLETAKEPTIQATSIIVPIAETTGNGLLIIAPFSGPAAPELVAAAGICHAVSTGCKILNSVAGGTDFTTSNIAGDVVMMAIPGGKNAKVGMETVKRAYEQAIVKGAFQTGEAFLKNNEEEK